MLAGAFNFNMPIYGMHIPPKTQYPVTMPVKRGKIYVRILSRLEVGRKLLRKLSKTEPDPFQVKTAD